LGEFESEECVDDLLEVAGTYFEIGLYAGLKAPNRGETNGE